MSEGGMSQKFDTRTVMLVLLLTAVVAITLASDNAVYHGPPKTFLGRLLAIPHALLFPIFNDRISTNVAVGIVFGVIAFLVGGSVWFLAQRFIIEPLHIRNAVLRTEREERWYNKFRRD
jgi:hypothetical protein